MANYSASPTGQLNEDKTPRVSRNYHDRQHHASGSMPFGRVRPTLCQFLQGNSTVKLDTHCAVQTQPTLSPVFGNLTVSNIFVVAPLRLYVAGLYGNNLLENDFVDSLLFPKIYSSDNANWPDWPQGDFIGVGSLLASLRYPRISPDGYPIQPSSRPYNDITYQTASGPERNVYENFEDQFDRFNALSVLAYIDSCLHYVVDPFDRTIPFEDTMIETLWGDDEEDTFSVNRTVYGVPYENLVNLIYEAKGFSVPNPVMSDGSLPFDCLVDTNGERHSIAPQVRSWSDFGHPHDMSTFDKISTMSFVDGLFPARYKPDYFVSWYDPEQVQKLTSVSFDDGSYMGLRLSQSQFNQRANALIKGQTVEDYNETTYGIELKLTDHPIFVGSDHFTIAFNDVLNQQASGPVPLGTAVARGYAASKLRKEIEFTTLEPALFLCLTSVVPDVTYWDDVPAHLFYRDLGDTPNRFYDGVGFQSLPMRQMQYTGVLSIDERTIGEQPFYYENMLSYDHNFGLLATDSYASYGFRRNAMDGILYDPMSDTLDDNIGFSYAVSKYVNNSSFDYPFPTYAPIGAGTTEDIPAIENIFLYLNFDLRVLEPLTNQVIARATY